MGRHRKFDLNEIVYSTIRSSYYTIVGYNPEAKTNRYGCVQTDPLGRWSRGEIRWIDSSELIATGRRSVKPGRIYRANLREGTPEERGCGCNCCPHVKGYEPEG